MNEYLLAMIFLPLAAAVLLMSLRADRSVARWTALIATVATLLVSLAVAGEFAALPFPGDGSPVQPRFELRHTWMSFPFGGHEIHLQFFLGLDGISLLLVMLTALLTVSAVLASWESVKERATEYYACLLILETGMIGAFCAFDLLLFYVFFEFTLIPLFFLIGIWGGADRRRAATRFFIYTLSGSLVTLLGIVALVLSVASRGVDTPFSIPAIAQSLQENPLPLSLQTVLFLALSAGFCIKVPLVPFHTWLPLAHVEAPTAGSVLLAGVLLKLGTYGFLRICLPILPGACVAVGVPLIAILSVIGIIYGALCALVQSDIKKLIAYSSVSHLGFCMLGLFALNREGMSGSVLQMINHGLSTGALFLLIGMLYERYHTRQLADFGGLAARLPMFSICLIFVSLSSMGLPGLNGFVGEFLSLIGMFKAHPVYAIIGTSGVILGAWYLLTMLQKALFGPVHEPDTHGEVITDMRVREWGMLAPLMILCLYIGVHPQPLLDTIRPDLDRIARLYETQPAAETAGRNESQALARAGELKTSTEISK